MDRFLFKTLDPSFLDSHVEVLIAMTKRNIDNEYWGEAHFRSTLNKKWEYSFYSTDKHGRIAGFVIASEKEHTAHIHKFVVDAEFQNQGLGSDMLHHLQQRAQKNISLKVDFLNEKAISFYKRNGFVIIGTDKNMYTMLLNVTA